MDAADKAQDVNRTALMQMCDEIICVTNDHSHTVNPSKTEVVE